MEDEKNESGFKVADRRRFDDAGNLRNEEQAETTVNQAAQNSTGQAQSPREGVTAGDSAKAERAYSEAQQGVAEQDINFVSFVVSLAHSAMVQLGEIPAPDGVEIPVNKEAAKQTIDILSMMKDKTAGNLSEEEGRMLEEILHNLRMSFVRAASKRT